MLSSLSSLADRNFILGFVLPVIVAMLAFLGLFREAPVVADLWAAIGNSEGIVTLSWVLLAMWLFSVLLLVFNTPLYRVLEGYWGPLASKKRGKAACEAATTALDKINNLEKQEVAAKAAREDARKRLATGTISSEDDKRASDAYIEAQRVHAMARREYHGRYPRPPQFALPTTFGNVIRAFESYPLEVYGAEGTSVWLRLLAVIPAGYQKALDSARAEADFFVNSCFLAAILAFALSLRLMLYLIQFSIYGRGFLNYPFDGVWYAQGLHAWRDLAAAGLSALASFVAYRSAISRASAWGDIVRSAFDLYLPALAAALGYELPATQADRRRFWRTMTGTFLEDRRSDPAPWETKAAK